MPTTTPHRPGPTPGSPRSIFSRTMLAEYERQPARLVVAHEGRLLADGLREAIERRHQSLGPDSDDRLKPATRKSK